MFHLRIFHFLKFTDKVLQQKIKLKFIAKLEEDATDVYKMPR
jgi:hypothetical protein